MPTFISALAISLALVVAPTGAKAGPSIDTNRGQTSLGCCNA